MSGTELWWISGMTPNADVADVETKAFAAESLLADTHLGTVGQRPHDISGVITASDSVGGDDEVWLRVTRVVADANDNMTGAAILTMFDVSYSDT
jgi:hypothetical protein